MLVGWSSRQTNGSSWAFFSLSSMQNEYVSRPSNVGCATKPIGWNQLLLVHWWWVAFYCFCWLMSLRKKHSSWAFFSLSSMQNEYVPHPSNVWCATKPIGWNHLLLVHWWWVAFYCLCWLMSFGKNILSTIYLCLIKPMSMCHVC